MAFTYFFRDMQTLEIAADDFVPAVIGRKYVHIWDAGCAMGPEPYSLAIILAERMGTFAFRNVHIDATDIDESNLFEDIIKHGVYPEEQLRRIPTELFSKYFEKDTPGNYRLVAKIRKCLSFYKHDLLTLKPIRENYSMVVCKNVLLHFKEEERLAVIKMFYDSLLAKGYLVLEQTQKLPDDMKGWFQQINNNVQVFQKI